MRLLIYLIFALLIFPPSLWAATIYADSSLAGDCVGGAGTSYDPSARDCGASDGTLAWNTFQELLDNIACSDTGNVRDGTYNEGTLDTTAMPTTCVEGTKITIQGYSGDSCPVITRTAAGTNLLEISGGVDWVTMDSLCFNSANATNAIIKFNNADPGGANWQFSNSEFKNNQKNIVSCRESSDCTGIKFIDNTVEDNQQGITLNADVCAQDETAAELFAIECVDDVVFTGNTIKNVIGKALVIGPRACTTRGERATVTDNVIYNDVTSIGHRGESGVEFHVCDSTFARNKIIDIGQLCKPADTTNYDKCLAIAPQGTCAADEQNIIDSNIFAGCGGSTAMIILQEENIVFTNNLVYRDFVSDCTKDNTACCENDRENPMAIIKATADTNDTLTMRCNTIIDGQSIDDNPMCTGGDNSSDKILIRFEGTHDLTAPTNNDIDYNAWFQQGSTANNQAIFRNGATTQNYDTFTTTFDAFNPNGWYLDPPVVFRDDDQRVSEAGNALDENYELRRQSTLVNACPSNANRPTDIDGRGIRGNHDIGPYEQYDKVL